MPNCLFTARWRKKGGSLNPFSVNLDEKKKTKAAARSWLASAATNGAAADDQGPRRDGARTKHIHTQIPCVSGVFRFAETLSSSELGGLAHFENARRGGRGTRAFKHSNSRPIRD
jgi:hypothetical protein